MKQPDASTIFSICILFLLIVNGCAGMQTPSLDADAYYNRGIAYKAKGQYDQAISDYSKVIEINPRYAKAYYNRGNAYKAKGRHEQAISDYSKAIEINPRDDDAYYNRGHVYNDKGQYEQAISDYSKAIEIAPMAADAYGSRGNVYSAKGQHEQAISDYSKAIEINPRYAKTYYARGNSYNAKGRYDQAISDFSKTIEINPRYAEAYNNRGFSHYLKREYGKAWEDVQKAQDLGLQIHPEFLKDLRKASQPDKTFKVQSVMSPDRTELLVAVPQKEVVYYFNNNADRLCYTYKIPGEWRPSGQSGLLRSEDGQAYAGVFLYSAKELEKFEGPDLVTRAAKLITRGYEKRLGLSIDRESLTPFQSQWPGTIKWSGSWPMEQGGQYKASKIFVEIAPRWLAQITVTGATDEDALARHILETLKSTSEPECYWPFIRQYFPILLDGQAISNNNKVLEKNRRYADAYLKRGNTYKSKGQYDKAILDYSKAIEINPRDDTAYHARGFAYGKKGQYGSAILDYNKAIEINPRNDKAYFDRGNAYGKKGQYGSAILDYSKAIKISPKYKNAYYARGYVFLENLGNKKMGCHDLKKACELGLCEDYNLVKKKGFCE